MCRGCVLRPTFGVASSGSCVYVSRRISRIATDADGPWQLASWDITYWKGATLRNVALTHAVRDVSTFVCELS